MNHILQIQKYHNRHSLIKMTGFTRHLLYLAIGTIISSLCLSLVPNPFFHVSAQEKKPQNQLKPQRDVPTAKALTLKEVVHLVLNKSHQVHIQQLDIIKSDTELRKNNSQYSPSIESGWQVGKRKDRFSNSLTSKNETDTSSLYLRAKKLFSSGTYFETEVSDNRVGRGTVDNPAFNSFSSGDTFSPPTLHTTKLSLVLRQELLKNAFGYAQRRQNRILANQSEIQRQQLTYDLSQLVASTLVDFWSLAIAQENVRTAERLLQNLNNIHKITGRKRRLGLAETFELNQWNALISTAKVRLKNAKLSRDTMKRDLGRALNLEPGYVFGKITELYGKIPQDIEATKDLQFAYTNRPDFKFIQLQRKNAEDRLEIAQNQLLPSLSVGARYTSQGFDRELSESSSQVQENKYPDYSFDFRLEYPLWDEGLKVDLRNAKIDLRKLDTEEKQLRRQIKDQINQGIQSIKTSHYALEHTKSSLASVRIYYRGLLKRYRQGRFSATAVKEALDSLAQSEQSHTETIINFNIALVRYDLTRNFLFQKYEVDIDQVINRMQRQF